MSSIFLHLNVNNSQLSVSAASALCEGVNVTVSVGGVVHLSTGEKGHITRCSGRIGICLAVVLRCPGQWEEAT